MRILGYTFCVLLGLITPTFCFSQQIDTAKVEQYKRQVEDFLSQENYESALEPANELLNYLEVDRSRQPLDYAWTHYNLGIIHLVLQNEDDAISHLTTAKKTYTTQENQKENVGQCSYYLGIVYQRKEKWVLAEGSFKEALKLVPLELKKPTLHNLGYLCKQQHKISEAIAYYRKVLRLRNQAIDLKQGDTLDIIITANNVSALYLDEMMPDSAQVYLDLALAYALPIDNYLSEVSDTYTNQGRYYEVKGFLSFQEKGLSFNKEKYHWHALNFHESALEIREKLQDTVGLLNSWINVGANYEYLQQFEAALQAYKEGEKLLTNSKIAQEDKIKLFLNMSDVYLHQGKEDSASIYKEKCFNLDLNEQALRTILDQPIQKAVHIVKLNAENEKIRGFIWAAAIIAGLSVLAFGLGMLNFDQKKKRLKLEVKKAEDDKMNTIDEAKQKILEAQNAAKEELFHQISDKLHTDIGNDLARLKREFELYIPLINGKLGTDTKSLQKQANYESICKDLNEQYKKVRELSHDMKALYLQNGLLPALRELTEKLSRLGLKVNLLTHKMESLELEQRVELNVFRIIQEALGNTVKHANANKTNLQLIYKPPKLKEDKGILSLMIEDDGEGFVPSKKTKSMGLKSMREWAEALNGSLEIDSQPKNGCTIMVEIPLLI